MKTLPKFEERDTCRVCGNKTTQILDLGTTPLADRFVDRPDAPEDFYPLRLSVCLNCTLVQLKEDIDDTELFATEYAFFTGTTSSVQHFKEYAATIKSLYPEQSRGYVIEIGSNDGTLLKEFTEAKDILGIDPADKPYEKAQEDGIKTIQAFFNSKTAKDVGGSNDLIMANNVLAHVTDPLDFMKGVKYLLSREGVAVVEVQYLPDLLFKNEFDNVYHEHRSFFSLTALNYLVKRAGLMIEHVRKVSTQGGSIRVYIRQKGHDKLASVENMLSDEMEIGIDSPQAYQGLQARFNYNKHTLINTLLYLKRIGKSIYGYGASAKSNTMFNYFGISTSYLDKITDLTPFKFGKYSPGMHIPIVEQSDSDMPDYYLVSVWNYLPQILEREKKFIAKGGHFIVPIPYVQII